MRDTITIDEIDFAALAEADQRAIHALVVARNAEEDPDDTPTCFEDLVLDWSQPREFRRVRRWVARHAGETIGFAQLMMSLADNLALAHAGLFVRSDARRNGIGRAMLRSVATAAEDEGRTSTMASSYVNAAGVPFLEGLGMVRGQVNHRNRLFTAGIDRGLLETWIAQAADRATGYSLVAWDDICPPEHVDAFCRVNGVMNTAPLDDLDVEDEVMTPELLADQERVSLELGTHSWTICARHDASGEFVGFTEIYFSRFYPDLAWQGNTGIDPAHRNLGLGRWIKAANLLRLVTEKPEVRKIDTQNAGSNEPMLTINHALGFFPAAVVNVYQAPTAQLIEALS